MNEVDSAEVKDFISFLQFFSSFNLNNLRLENEFGPNRLKKIVLDFGVLKESSLSVLKDLASVNYDDDAKRLHKNMKELKNSLSKPLSELESTILVNLSQVQTYFCSILDELKIKSSKIL